MINFILRFLIRWLVCALGLWIAAGIAGGISYQNSTEVIIIAGLILAIINTVIKPFVVFLSLPAVILSLGLFMVVVNALMVLLVAWIYAPLQVSSFWSAILAGVIVGLVNWLVGIILKSKAED